ncbi:MAG: O-antigen ligase family protein [Candidatus Kapabacteria bacterium]|nr:O-antigen ligase family protein [Candidatus Kapabacteria bacterium]
MNGILKIELKDFREKITFSSLLILAIIAAASIWLGIDQDYGLYVLAGIFGIALIYVFIKYPKFWLNFVAVFTGTYFVETKPGVSAFDVIAGAFLLGGLFFWLIWTIGFKKERLFRNPADKAILIFFLFSPINAIIAVLNEVSFLDWFREFGSYAMILYYFPIRYHIREKQDIITFLICFSISVLYCVFNQFYAYNQRAISMAVYAFELERSLRINQTLFTAATILGIVFTLYTKKPILKTLVLFFTVLSFGALLISFSRTFWVILMAVVVIMMFYIDKKSRIQIITATLIILATIFGIVYSVFKDNTFVLLKVAEKRLTSTTKGQKDESVQIRFSEYDKVFEGIKSYPLGGNGLAKKISFFDPFGLYTINTNIIHNGYLWFMFRFGIPASLLIFFFYIYYLFKLERQTRKTKDKFLKALYLGCFMLMLLMIISDFTSAQFMYRDGIFTSAVAIAFAEKFVNYTSNSNQIELKND